MTHANIAQQNHQALISHLTEAEAHHVASAMLLDPLLPPPALAGGASDGPPPDPEDLSEAAFEQSDFARHLLSMAYPAWRAGAIRYGANSWMNQPASYHLQKAILHVVREHEGAPLDDISGTPHHVNGFVRWAMYDYQLKAATKLTEGA